MITNVAVVLETLACFEQSDGIGGSEPYIWPAVFSVTGNPLGLQFFGDVPARLEIADGIKAGTTQSIPIASGETRFQLLDGQTVTNLVLVVALLEHDSTPSSAIKKGHDAFNTALQAQLNVLTLQNLRDAKAAHTPEGDATFNAIVATIKTAVTSAVTTAIKNDEGLLSAIFTNNDDFIGFSFAGFSEDSSGHVPSQTFQLTFTKTQTVTSHGSTQQLLTDSYRIHGRVEVVAQQPPVQPPIDLCKGPRAELAMAQQAIAGEQSLIQSLQSELVHAAPGAKAQIVAQITAHEATLDHLNAARDAAQKALNACIDRFHHGPVVVHGGVLSHS